MQRIGILAVGLLLLGGRGAAQQAAGTALWRVAATTLAIPPALALGPAAVFWNPAQNQDTARTQLAFEAIQTPASVGASGMLAAARFRVRALAGGHIGLVYGRVGLTDLTRTTETPDPIGSAIPVYTFALGGTWSGYVGPTTLGATLAFHETRLDTARANRWTLDLGASRFFLRERLRVAAATHFFSSLSANDPAQDIYAGIEARLWRGPLWGDRATLYGRYGISFAHGFTADHHFGLGGELARTLALDIALAREGSYGAPGWRPVAGLRITIGKYRITLARDTGVSELGSAYRVGVDARFQ